MHFPGPSRPCRDCPDCASPQAGPYMFARHFQQGIRSTLASAVSIVTCSIGCAVPMATEKLIEPFNTDTEIHRICVLVSCLVFTSVHSTVKYSTLCSSSCELDHKSKSASQHYHMSVMLIRVVAKSTHAAPQTVMLCKCIYIHKCNQ